MDKLVDFLLTFYGPTPYLFVFGILLACGLGIPLPEDIVLFAAGLLSYYGVTDLIGITVLSFFGVLFGDSIIFFLGARYGRTLTKKWFFHKLLPDDRLSAVQAKFNQRGNKLIFAARFMPGLRAPIFFSAGTLHLPYRVFLFYDGLAALLSVPAIIGAVYYFGDEVDKVVRLIQRIENGIVFVIAVVVLVIMVKWYITHRKLKRT
ncbi:MAG TPA: DedA family protein [Bdellovibrionales bacterium]|nr:MAG: SNARE associated protein [Bdellovibrionales bacterium GWB1_52_6]OFZ05286.1 MAG: SNARE associated protein [Bdellovibrionales bacterium GWA1_52_35]OFZ42171.1 MAG: SNARE associated protein [Bdellovibrionales bacterium GWC1_52_8]HAR43934.1 DedA family protein [Bdellovibrionales bacterium]HCM38576.1 DedA family protein [Bdellovibrionales bacterium]